MSKVTNIMLSDDSLLNESIQQAIQSKLHLQHVDEENVGGTKSLEATLYLGAFNNFDLDAFLMTMRLMYNPHDVDDVQLFIKEQDDSKWREIQWME